MGTDREAAVLEISRDLTLYLQDLLMLLAGMWNVSTELAMAAILFSVNTANEIDLLEQTIHHEQLQ